MRPQGVAVTVGTNGYGAARNLLVSLGVALLIGAGLSGTMAIRERSAAVAALEQQATTITDSSLTLVFKPSDTGQIASPTRTDELSERLGAVVLDPSEFDSVTLYDDSGVILYSTDEGRIGNDIAGEEDRIAAALRGRPRSSLANGVVSVMVPLEFRSGVGEDSVIELTRSDGPIASAGSAWRTMAIALFLGVVIVGLVFWRTARLANSVSASQPSFSPRRATRAAAATEAPERGPSDYAPRKIEVPTHGLKEEAEARRMAEERARAAEDRLGVLQGQYRKTLEELRIAEDRSAETPSPDPALERRAMRAEERVLALEEEIKQAASRIRELSRAHDETDRIADELKSLSGDRQALVGERDALTDDLKALRSERDDLAARLELAEQPSTDPELTARVHQAETEVIGLRAELDGAQTQLDMVRRDLETAREEVERSTTEATRVKEIQEDLDAAHIEALRARETSESATTDLDAARSELADARSELRALRNEEQRAAMLEDELRASKAELESAVASHRAELVEHEAEFEDKVRAAREEFQSQIDEMERRHADDAATAHGRFAEQLSTAETEAAEEMEALRRELAERTERFSGAEAEINRSRAESEALGDDLIRTKMMLEEMQSNQAQVLDETAQLRESSEINERLAADAVAQVRSLETALAAATQDNSDLNRRLQEIEARRHLETAATEGRADLDDLLRITQERLAGQTEKLIAAEERAHGLEREVQIKTDRIDEVESELRQQQMTEAMRIIRGEPDPTPADGDEAEDHEAVVVGEATIEDRRATTPFMNELTIDARKSLSRIMGLTQILKHKKDAKDQSQLIRQLTTNARRLEHVVADMADADRLVHGTVELQPKRIDLEPLVQRLIEESDLGGDHELSVRTERVVVPVDQLRTEQILAGLLRNAGDRTPAKKPITDPPAAARRRSPRRRRGSRALFRRIHEPCGQAVRGDPRRMGQGRERRVRRVVVQACSCRALP